MKLIVKTLLITLISIQCFANQNDVIFVNDFKNKLNIEEVPLSFDNQTRSNFNRYTKFVSATGGVIHILAQNQLSNEQIVRSRSVLEHFLTNYPGSEFGENKLLIANQMVENEAALYLMNGSDNGENPVEPPGQPLYQDEIQVEGHQWYTNQNYDHRDATYEEILHFVHDTGIGVDGPNSYPGVLPDFQSEIRSAQVNALANNIWGIGSPDWISGLTQENSLSQEYLAALIDSYYGLWGAWSEQGEPISATHGMWGIYLPKTRDEIATEDTMGHQLMNNKFFHPYITYIARIDANFSGTFTLSFDDNISYTHHSRYLKNVMLLGQNNTKVKVNEFDNNITGNEGNNTVIFSGSSDEYDISTAPDKTIITDNISQRDGINVLKNIESVQFNNETITL